MVVRRNDTRRRRVVVDPSLQKQSSDTASGKSDASDSNKPNATRRNAKGGEGKPYSFGADRRNLLKTTDLLPKRLLSCSLVVLLLLSSIAVLNLLSAYAPEWSEQLGQSTDALALTGRGTIASWFSSFLLIISGLASLQIYALRQHRRDDYRGTYRLWLWMAALLTLGSLNCVVDLGQLATNLLTSLTSFTIEGRPWLPAATKIVLLSILVARGLFEVRASSGTFVLVLMVWLAYTLAAVLQLPSVRPETVYLSSETLLGNCLLFATSTLLLAELTYARYIYMQAHGLIKHRVVKEQNQKKKSKPVKRTKAKSTAKAKPTNSKTSSRQVNQAKPKPAATNTRSSSTESNASTEDSPKPMSRRAKKKAKVASTSNGSVKRSNRKQRQDEDYGDDLDQDGVIKLSKSERRRRRKEERRRKAA